MIKWFLKPNKTAWVILYVGIRKSFFLLCDFCCDFFLFRNHYITAAAKLILILIFFAFWPMLMLLFASICLVIFYWHTLWCWNCFCSATHGTHGQRIFISLLQTNVGSDACMSPSAGACRNNTSCALPLCRPSRTRSLSSAAPQVPRSPAPRRLRTSM